MKLVGRDVQHVVFHELIGLAVHGLYVNRYGSSFEIKEEVLAEILAVDGAERTGGALQAVGVGKDHLSEGAGVSEFKLTPFSVRVVCEDVFYRVVGNGVFDEAFCISLLFGRHLYDEIGMSGSKCIHGQEIMLAIAMQSATKMIRYRRVTVRLNLSRRPAVLRRAVGNAFVSVMADIVAM